MLAPADDLIRWGALGELRGRNVQDAVRARLQQMGLGYLGARDARMDAFRFHPAYRVDLILWRTLLGGVSEAAFARVVEPAAKRNKKMKEPDAVKAMHDYYQAHRDSLPASIRDHRNVIVTLGAQGALLVNHDRTYHQSSPAVEAVDTTAAGDAFNGALALAPLARVRVVEKRPAVRESGEGVGRAREGARPLSGD